MKVIFVGSVARSLVNFRGPLIRELIHAGAEVVACAPRADDETIEGVGSLGARFREVRITRTGMNPMADLRTIIDLRRVFKEERPDVVVSYTIKPVIYSGVASWFLPGVSLHGMITGLGYAFGASDGVRQKMAGLAARTLYKIGLKTYDGLIFQNADDLEDFKGRSLIGQRAKVTIVNGSGVDLDRFQPQPLQERGSFLMIARLLREKGVREYIAAADIVKKQRPDAVFRLAGDFDENPNSVSRHEIEKAVKAGVIEYLGRLPDVRPAVAACDVYVLPSYREGTPRTVLEAMAVGRAVITTQAPGCRETVIEGETGMLVPPRDIDALARAMVQLFDNPSLVEAMGKEGLRSAQKKYDVRLVNAAVMEFLGV